MSRDITSNTQGKLTAYSVRQLDDDELDLEDEIERTERVLAEAEEDADQQEYVTQEKVTMDLEIPRQPIPEPSDGEVCT